MSQTASGHARCRPRWPWSKRERQPETWANSTARRCRYDGRLPRSGLVAGPAWSAVGREFAPRGLAAKELVRTVFVATGTTSPEERRTAPSARALHSIEAYVAASDVGGIAAGLNCVDLRNPALEQVRSKPVASLVTLGPR